MPLFEKQQLRAAPNQKPIRLDNFIAGRVKNLDKHAAAGLSAGNMVLVNGSAGEAGLLVKPGDIVSILSPYSKHLSIEPVPINLEIIFENRHYLVINKQAGLVLHPGLGNYNNSLLHALAHYYRENGVSAMENGLVHRLDKETSGLLVVAKTPEAFSNLSAQFKDRRCSRTYHALVWGQIREESGSISVHIGRDPVNNSIIRVFAEGEGGKPALTHFKVLERFTAATLVECSLETGRTHQVRLHMASMGHAVIGDKRYPAASISPETLISRHALHAFSLGFADPAGGKQLEFKCGHPQDFMDLADKLRQP
jgi:23S rRNA pseudouridine1911/1915/1917 synthase